MTALFRLPARLLRRHRRGAAALFAALAACCLALSLRPSPPPTQGVMVAARDLPAGTVLAAGDLVARPYSAELAPPTGLTEAGPLLGRVLAAPVDGGVPVTARSVVGPALASSAEGRALAPVRLPDPDLAVLLSPGVVIDVIAPQDNGRGAVVAAGARVVTIPSAAHAGGGPLGGGGNDGRGLLVILEVDPGEVTALAQAAAASRLTVSLR